MKVYTKYDGAYLQLPDFCFTSDPVGEYVDMSSALKKRAIEICKEEKAYTTDKEQLKNVYIQEGDKDDGLTVRAEYNEIKRRASKLKQSKHKFQVDWFSEQLPNGTILEDQLGSTYLVMKLGGFYVAKDLGKSSRYICGNPLAWDWVTYPDYLFKAGDNLYRVAGVLKAEDMPPQCVTDYVDTMRFLEEIEKAQEDVVNLELYPDTLQKCGSKIRKLESKRADILNRIYEFEGAMDIYADELMKKAGYVPEPIIQFSYID